MSAKSTSLTWTTSATCASHIKNGLLHDVNDAANGDEGPLADHAPSWFHCIPQVSHVGRHGSVKRSDMELT